MRPLNSYSALVHLNYEDRRRSTQAWLQCRLWQLKAQSSCLGYWSVSCQPRCLCQYGSLLPDWQGTRFLGRFCVFSPQCVEFGRRKNPLSRLTSVPLLVSEVTLRDVPHEIALPRRILSRKGHTSVDQIIQLLKENPFSGHNRCKTFIFGTIL